MCATETRTSFSDVAPRSVADRCGFTLLETLLALVILALLLTTVYGAVSRTLYSKTVGEDRAALFAAGRDAVLRIADDIEGALLPGAVDRGYFRGREGGGQPPTDGIEFVSVNRGGYGLRRVCPGPVLVRYGLEPLGDRRDMFILRRDEDSWAALIAEADGLTSALDELTDAEEENCAKYESRPLLYCHDPVGAASLPGSCVRVVGLGFRYYDKAIGDFREEWDSTEDPRTGSTGGRLPAAVQVALYLADERGRIHEFTTVTDVPLGRDQPVTPRPEDVDDLVPQPTPPDREATGSRP